LKYSPTFLTLKFYFMYKMTNKEKETLSNQIAITSIIVIIFLLITLADNL
jgi:putative effector of murein hydrolase